MTAALMFACSKKESQPAPQPIQTGITPAPVEEYRMVKFDLQGGVDNTDEHSDAMNSNTFWMTVPDGNINDIDITYIDSVTKVMIVRLQKATLINFCAVYNRSGYTDTLPHAPIYVELFVNGVLDTTITELYANTPDHQHVCVQYEWN